MKKNVLFSIVFFIINTCVLSQTKSKCVDTAVIIVKKIKDFDHQVISHDFLDSYYRNDTLFYYSDKKIKSSCMPLRKLYTEGKFDVCPESYFFFYTKNRKLIAQGNWNVESFTGKYIDYYENGQKKSEGFYDTERKNKTWKYFDENGKLIKEEEYDSTGNLISK